MSSERGPTSSTLPPYLPGRSKGERFREDLLRSLRNHGASAEAPITCIERRIRTALFTGLLRGGDRLPSVREVAEASGISRHATMRVYAALAEADLVEARERSGVFVSAVASPAQEPGPETARWLVDVLAEAYEEHRIKIPNLADLIRHWTASVPLRVGCVESVEDLRVGLSQEMREHFGLEASCVPLPERGALGTSDASPSLEAADLWITTSYHAVELRPRADHLGKTLITATLSPLTVTSIERRLREAGELTIVCLDPAFGHRIRLIHGGRYGDAIRVVPAADAAAVAAIDRSRPVLLTAAARARLGDRAGFRLVAPVSPSFSPDFTRTLLTHIVRLNIERSRM